MSSIRGRSEEPGIELHALQSGNTSLTRRSSQRSESTVVGGVGLPDEVLLKVFDQIHPDDFLAAHAVSKQWNRVGTEHSKLQLDKVELKQVAKLVHRRETQARIGYSARVIAHGASALAAVAPAAAGLGYYVPFNIKSHNVARCIVNYCATYQGTWPRSQTGPSVVAECEAHFGEDFFYAGLSGPYGTDGECQPEQKFIEIIKYGGIAVAGLVVGLLLAAAIRKAALPAAKRFQQRALAGDLEVGLRDLPARASVGEASVKAALFNKLTRRLFAAVDAGDVAAVLEIHGLDIPFDLRADNGETLLARAIEKNNADVIAAICDAGQKPTHANVIRAVQLGNQPVVLRLFAALQKLAADHEAIESAALALRTGLEELVTLESVAAGQGFEGTVAARDEQARGAYWDVATHSEVQVAPGRVGHKSPADLLSKDAALEAFQRSRFDFAMQLLKHASPERRALMINYAGTNDEGKSLFHRIAGDRELPVDARIENFLFMLENGGNMNARDALGATPRMLIAYGNAELKAAVRAFELRQRTAR